MRIAEQVTFGGSGLEREAGLRGDAEAQARMWADPDARVLPLWRGKPLIAGEERDRLGLLAPDHEVLALAGEPRLFLGLDGDAPRFAADISRWEPTGLDTAALGAFFDPSEQHHPALPPDQRFAELRGVMARLSPRDAELAATARALYSWHRTHGFCARCGAASAVAMAGWQRICPSCGGHHFPRTDPVVIMLITRGNSVLMGRSPAWPEGMYSLLAGFIEPGEPIEAAVRREVAEETGVRVGAVEYLASQPWPFPASLMLGCWGRAESEEITIDPVEIEDALWVTREEMVSVMAGLHDRIRPARRGAIAHFLIANWLADRLD
ncbi:NAD(+) diphosphatase [Acidimangrovimonas pyrenivorans]|uniref:NAD(+) diphosphatase n=1 Tax=Acidimangrovimonas pyrenivorans TaxID=2030798 RepID=A0ABV7AGJ8_9RHOB